ncbi:MAG: hypothetical protein WCO60_06055 [Verrucomicrobiota bacterium]
MKIQRVVLAALSLTPALAFAHPGHEVNALHLHAGVPTASNSLDLRVLCAGLVLGLAVHAFRSAKRR